MTQRTGLLGFLFLSKFSEVIENMEFDSLPAQLRNLTIFALFSLIILEGTLKTITFFA